MGRLEGESDWRARADQEGDAATCIRLHRELEEEHINNPFDLPTAAGDLQQSQAQVREVKAQLGVAAPQTPTDFSKKEGPVMSMAKVGNARRLATPISTLTLGLLTPVITRPEGRTLSAISSGGVGWSEGWWSSNCSYARSHSDALYAAWHATRVPIPGTSNGFC